MKGDARDALQIPKTTLTLRKGRRTQTSASDATGDAASPLYTGPVYVTAETQHGQGVGAAPPASSSGSGRSTLVAAGTSLPAVLANPLELDRGTATVLAKLTAKTAALPSGTRFIGRASASRGRVTLEFRTAILPDGRELEVEAEAQGPDGTFGLPAETEDPAEDDGTGAVVGEVAKETASDLINSALPGLAGRTVDRYGRASGRRRRDRDGPSVHLAAGTPLQLFLHKAIQVSP